MPDEKNEQEQDKELNEDDLDTVAGGGTGYHGKKDQCSGMDGMTDACNDITF
ncbi:MAG: hypothetical protein N2C14_06925 [Planctomycetales bacterium]